MNIRLNFNKMFLLNIAVYCSLKLIVGKGVFLIASNQLKMSYNKLYHCIENSFNLPVLLRITDSILNIKNTALNVKLPLEGTLIFKKNGIK